MAEELEKIRPRPGPGKVRWAGFTTPGLSLDSDSDARVRAEPCLESWAQMPVSGYRCVLEAGPRAGEAGASGDQASARRSLSGGREARSPLAVSSLQNPTRSDAPGQKGGADTRGLRHGGPGPHHSQRVALGRQGPGTAASHTPSWGVQRHHFRPLSVRVTLPTAAAERRGLTWRAGVRVPSTSNRQRTRSFLRAPSAETAMAATPRARGRGQRCGRHSRLGKRLDQAGPGRGGATRPAGGCQTGKGRGQGVISAGEGQPGRGRGGA